MPSGGKRLDAVLLETNSKCSKRFFLPQGHSHCKGTWNIRAKKQCVSMENQGTGGQRVLLFFSVKKGTVCSSQPSNLQWAVDSCLPVHVDGIWPEGWWQPGPAYFMEWFRRELSTLRNSSGGSPAGSSGRRSPKTDRQGRAFTGWAGPGDRDLEPQRGLKRRIGA